MRTALKSILPFVSLTVLITSCSQSDLVEPGQSDQAPEQSTTASSEDCRTVLHSTGETMICGQPETIVSLGPFTLEMLLSLGFQPSGYADHTPFAQDTFTNPAQQIPYLGDRVTTQPANVGTVYEPSIEAILALEPDLIVGNEWLKAPETLAQIAPLLILEWGDTESSLRAIAQAVGQPEKAESLIANLDQEIAAARGGFEPVVASHPTTLVLSSSDSREFQVLSSPDNLCSSLVSDLGFDVLGLPDQNQGSSDGGRPTPISIEALPQFEQADTIILLGSDRGSINQFDDLAQFKESQTASLKTEWENNAIAQSMKASQNGRVYFIPVYVCLGLPGPVGTELYLEELQEQLL
ncbi:MAG: iron-siderophore ABC transporter substrate-binding protein [Cyanobacteria bacterium P01_E01_bin.6]